MPVKPPPPGHVLYLLGETIAQRRRARGLTQVDLAGVIGVGLSMQRLYETGLRNPPIEALVRMASACDLPLSAFLSPLDDYDMAQLPVREPRKLKKKKP